MEVYIKGKFDFGTGTSAYVVVSEGKVVAEGCKNLGTEFTLCGRTFECDQFSTEIAAAVCGVARCGSEGAVKVFSNNKSVVKWLGKGDEPDARREIVGLWRKRTEGREVAVEWIPYFERDPSGNEWNERCCRLAEKGQRR